MHSAKRVLVGALGVGLTITGLSVTPAPAQANPAGTGVVISEVYGAANQPPASYGNDFIELYNPTSQSVDLSGWSVQYRSATGTSAQVTPLAGSIPAGGHYLVQEGNFATGNQLPTPDARGGISLSGTNGVVLLVSSTAPQGAPTGNLAGAPAPIVDVVGYGTTPTTYETARTGVELTNVTSAQRDLDGPAEADTDHNADDFAELAPTPVNSAGETQPPVTVTDPGDKTVVVDEPIAPFDLSASGGTAPYTWSASGLPSGLEVSSGGTVSGTPTATGVFEVTATATDSSTPALTDDETFTVTVQESLVIRPIAEIQGTGPRSPFAPETGTGAGETVTTEGVVTAIYRTGGFNGMYIQSGGTGGATDATPEASDAVFVWGSHSMPAGVGLGDSVRVTGAVSEFGSTSSNPESLTEITPASGGVTELTSALPPVTPLAAAYPRTLADREAHEGELLAPTDTFTVTNAYSTNQYGEIGLATGTRPLIQPTELHPVSDTAGIQAVKDDNVARGVVLDDGASTNFLPSGSNRDNMNIPLPYLTPDNPIRVGARATLQAPVVLDYRNSTWKFQPRQQVTDDGRAVVTFEDTRAQNQAPADVGGDIQIATFNVLNYFNTTGQAYDAQPNTECVFYNDRAGTPIGVNRCGTPNADAGNGPRGAATQASFERQQAKVVRAINALDAEIVGLQEIENSIRLLGETNRDDALAALVRALNRAAGTGTWRFVRSPAEATSSTNVGFQDAIRPAFIYKPAAVRPVGGSDVYFEASATGSAFANAREPLAQAFKATGALDSDAFAVILNHFKSKGDSDPPQSGNDNVNGEQGAFNGDRVRQAQKLVEFAESYASARDIEAVLLAGDFNAYSQEDPMQVLYDAGYDEVGTGEEESYSFSGLSGSLDHVLGNDAALGMVTGADVWEINANESVAFQYSRYNYNARDFWQPDTPFAASDHNPEIVGLDLPETSGSYTDVQILGTNDFHGRLLADGVNAAGAAVLSGAVKELRQEYPNTVFSAAGDLIGASTFESFIQHDEPTIEALNEAGLEVSAVGNHEFDQGYEDLAGRVQDLAEWEYLATNVEEPAGRDDLAETWTRTFGDIEVGFVGAVTEDLPTLVTPSGIDGVTVTDIVDATNAAAAELKEGGADVVVLLVHEGSPSTDCSSPSFTDPTTTWGNITQNASADVDAIISGHTHLAYNCQFPVEEWVTGGRSVTTRPVVSAGQYGTFLNQLVFTFDDATGELVAKSQDVIGLVGAGFEPDPVVAETVEQARQEAEVLGARPLGTIEGAFNRAKLSTGAENRGGESTLGNLVAEVHRWATRNPESGSAQIAFMNPGGLRADMTGGVDGETAYPKTVTYKQAAVVQPFANTLVNMDLTGAQIKTVLEQQWQRDGANKLPSRPFLRLGISDGFTYTYTQEVVTETATDGTTYQAPEGTVTGMWLDGEPIDLEATYSVTVNSFLASGGDNFREFANGSGKADTGKVDLQAMVDYLAAHAADAPLPVDYSQRAVEVELPADAPEEYGVGDRLVLDVASWTMSAPADLKDAELIVSIGDQVLGRAPLDNTIGTAVYDDYGTAHVDVVLGEGLPTGPQTVTLTGARTGTVVRVPVDIEAAPTTTVTVEDTTVSRKGGTVTVHVDGGDIVPTGTVTLTHGDRALGPVDVDASGMAVVRIPKKWLPLGTHDVVASYSGDALLPPAQDTFRLTVTKGG